MGWVGYGDWMTTKTPDRYQFVIYSPFHMNGKYKKSTKQHSMAMFYDRAKAVKKAKGLLRSYTVGESACAANQLSACSITDVQSQATKAYSNAGNTLGLHVSSYNPKKHLLMDEFKALLKSGHAFLNADISGKLQTFCDAYDVHLKRKSDKIPVMYVDLVTDRFGDKIFRLAKLRNGRNYYPNPYHYDVTSEEHMQQSEVPQWIVDRVSTLQIVDDGTYVEGVGYKHFDNAYTIHVDEVNPFVD
jgi:hypothetical protein